MEEHVTEETSSEMQSFANRRASGFDNDIYGEEGRWSVPHPPSRGHGSCQQRRISSLFFLSSAYILHTAYRPGSCTVVVSSWLSSLLGSGEWGGMLNLMNKIRDRKESKRAACSLVSWYQVPVPNSQVSHRLRSALAYVPRYAFIAFSCLAGVDCFRHSSVNFSHTKCLFSWHPRIRPTHTYESCRLPYRHEVERRRRNSDQQALRCGPRSVYTI